MRRFIIKSIVVLSLPILLLVYAFLIGVNENLHVADYDKKEVFLIGEPYQDNYSRYFKSSVNLDSIKVLAIGTSRVLQFKKEFFKESFFNLGYLVRTPSQTLKLIKHYDLRNKILIIRNGNHTSVVKTLRWEIKKIPNSFVVPHKIYYLRYF
jgi:hypothetical protein